MVSTPASYQPLGDSAKSVTLEVWGPRFVPVWANVFAGGEAPLVVLPDEGTRRAPADVIVNGRAEFRRAGDEPVLQPGDVLSNPLSDATFRVPLARQPVWSARREQLSLSLLERQAQLAGLQLAPGEPRWLLGAARAWRVGALRCQWEGPFVTAARWSWANTARASMAWHLWQVLASPAGFALERFAGTPVDEEDLRALLEVVQRFPAPRLRLLELETNAPWETRVVAGVTLRRTSLPWLRVEGALPAGVTVAGSSTRPVLRWRQVLDLRINGASPTDHCLWHDGLALELRAGDVLSWPGGAASVVSTR